MIREGFLEEVATARNPLFILGLLLLICSLNSMLLRRWTDCASATALLQETHLGQAHSKCLGNEEKVGKGRGQRSSLSLIEWCCQLWLNPVDMRIPSLNHSLPTCHRR